MFPNFTGSTRKPRQVNLSGRNNPNPFASNQQATNLGSSSRSAGSHQNALAAAQQDRIARQRGRERTNAATLLQRVWRGSVVRRGIKDTQRHRWDEAEHLLLSADEQPAQDCMELDKGGIHLDGTSMDLTPYDDGDRALSQLWALLQFLDLGNNQDFIRLQRFCARLAKTGAEYPNEIRGGPWPHAYLRLQDTCLRSLQREVQRDNYKMSLQNTQFLIEVVRFIFRQIPHNSSKNFNVYYNVLANNPNFKDLGLVDVTEPLLLGPDTVFKAHEAFAFHMLTLPELNLRLGHQGDLDALADKVDCRVLSEVLRLAFSQSGSTSAVKTAYPLFNTEPVQRLSLLGHFLYFYRRAHGFRNVQFYTTELDFVLVVSSLFSSLVGIVAFESSSAADSGSDDTKDDRMIHPNTLLREQFSPLVTQESISGLLVQLQNDPERNSSTVAGHPDPNLRTQIIANYILTIIRSYPRKADEIRMWLFMGFSDTKGKKSEDRIPVIRYFYSAAEQTEVYKAIWEDPRAAIPLLRSSSPNKSEKISAGQINDQWQIILIFIELYIFILKIVDDEEFFSGGQNNSMGNKLASNQPNVLQLSEIRYLVTFLKNLGFTMYYYAADILGTTKEDTQQDIRSLFRGSESSENHTSAQSDDSSARKQEVTIAGVQGMTLDYAKSLVTELLRAIYDRDSRRQFLPGGHWLMTSRFDMNNFIDAVVVEEETRNKVEEEDEEEDEQDMRLLDYNDPSSRLIGTGREQRIRALEKRQQDQKRASRQRYLQAVAPRLEILRNMPFLIPFTTRVKIFQRFVYMDKLKRRRGAVDEDVWRLMASERAPERAARHQAKIRREHEFDDAYEQFYDLGVNIKEPIQISFVDKHNLMEVGIDGGGVTKEFLTTVTNQALTPSEGIINMFVENDNHLLYPNPAAVDEQKELLREVGFKEDMPTFKAQVGDLLQRYEFLGRIIGKCMYEGILIDFSFAGFFLLKWALTGGTGLGPKENRYRATINDLRDFDEGLYQGLIQLKNYPGNVEDFSLNFTITDTLSLPPPGDSDTVPKTKTITRELKPGGASIPVTNANRLVYISDVARHRLQYQPYLQTSRFLQGLASIIQPSWLSMFNQSELQTLVGGSAISINVADLRRSTLYSGVYQIGEDGQEHPSIKLFWDVMEHDFTEEDRRKVLKFVTSTPRAPLLGFGTLNPPFSIRDSGSDETRLPSTSTCVNLLKLPRYTKRETCKTKLLQAVNSGAGFDLS